MKTQITNKELVTFFNWASNFLRRPNGIDNAFKKSIQINMKAAEPLIEKYQQRQEFIQRDNATVEPGEEGALKKVQLQNGELGFHYTKKAQEKLVTEINELANEVIEFEVAPLSKESSIPALYKNDYFAMRALSGIVVQKEMADKILFDFNEDEAADKKEESKLDA